MIDGVSSAPTIIYVQADGSSQRVRTRVGTSIMEAALRANVPGIEAKCRGNCACVTCHVYIDPPWQSVLEAASAMEESMLDFAEAADGRSRLACQVRVNRGCDGLVVEVPAEQRVLGL